MAESFFGAAFYSCSNCRMPVASHDDLISKTFQLVEPFFVFSGMEIQTEDELTQGRNGRAFLLSNVVNISVGPKEDRHLMTGLHTVADVFCCQCQEVLGWKYEKAYEESQKYKEGKFILEKAKVSREDR